MKLMKPSPSVRDCNAKPESSPRVRSKVQRARDSSRNLALHNGAPPPTDHRSWAEKAWEALVRSLIRSPIPCGSFDDSRSTFIDRYTKRSESGTAMQWLKFHLSYIFAYGANQTELPTPPSEGEPGEITRGPDGSVRVGIIGGELGRTIRSLMSRARSGNWQCRRVCYDIMMSKIGMPPATAEFIRGAYQSHAKALTKVKDPYTPMYDEFVLGRVKEKISLICKSLFAGKRFSHKDPIPSLRASYERGLGECGALLELIGGFNYVRTSSRLVEPDFLVSMFEKSPGQVSQIHFQDHEALVHDFQNYVDRLWMSRINKPLNANPCPIREPLKVRMITKGEAAEYYRAIELQKMMHSVMRKHPVFEYIGHPIDDLSWAQCFGTQSELLDDQFYVSGDYKGATDNLNPELSEHAWREICKHVMIGDRYLSETLYLQLGIKSLTGHMLHYPEKVGGVPLGIQSPARQTWGQLMGSPMSFPILCLVNCAATIAALDLQFTHHLRMKVNGDDIAFICNRREYEVWKEVTGICGLEFSLGKNYTSRQFIVMNSELRRPPLSGKTSSWRPGEIIDMTPEGVEDDIVLAQRLEWFEHSPFWRLEGFINQSILYRTVKKGPDAGQKKDVFWTDLQSLSHELLHGIAPRYQSMLMKVFLQEHHDVIEELPPYCNKWIPTALGGAGLAVPADTTIDKLLEAYDPERVRLQLRQAAYLACTPAVRLKRITRSKPITGQIGQIFRDILQISNTQVVPTIQDKPLHRNQHTLLGGKTFLGYLLNRTPALERVPVETTWAGPSAETVLSAPDGFGGDLRSESLTEDESRVTHAKEARYLNHQYNNWLRKANRHSLEPMNPQHIHLFQEHYAMVSYIERMVDRPSPRLLDYQPVTRWIPRASDFTLVE